MLAAVDGVGWSSDLAGCAVRRGGRGWLRGGRGGGGGGGGGESVVMATAEAEAAVARAVARVVARAVAEAAVGASGAAVLTATMSLPVRRMSAVVPTPGEVFSYTAKIVPVRRHELVWLAVLPSQLCDGHCGGAGHGRCGV